MAKLSDYFVWLLMSRESLEQKVHFLNGMIGARYTKEMLMS